MENDSINETKIIWTLNSVAGFGPQRLKKLLEDLRSKGPLTEPEIHAYLESPEHSSNFAHAFGESFSSADFERALETCSRLGIRILSLVSTEYPKRLREIYDPPAILYVQGDFIPEDEIAIAIVGTRRPSTYGFQTAARFSRELAARGITVVSGMARGIDAEAHWSAIKANGRTVAVLGSGLDVIYPAEHKSLFGQIVERGAVVSEFPLGTIPAGRNFPLRNRIISGLALGTVVVEASDRSGSLITAASSLDEGREVYAVPGPIDSITSSGTNSLIKKGAKLVTAVDDILEDLAGELRAAAKPLLELKKEESQSELPSDDLPPAHKIESLPPCGGGKVGGVIESSPPPNLPHQGGGNNWDNAKLAGDPFLVCFKGTSRSFDELVVMTGLAPAALQSKLLELELSGAIKRDFGGRFALVRSHP